MTSDQDPAAAPQTRPEAVATRRRRTGSGLSGMLLTELQRLASSLGITGVGRMRKGELVAAIQLKQSQSERPADQVGQVARPQKGTDVAERDIAQGSSSTASGVSRPAGLTQQTLPELQSGGAF
ncbi:MAG TPA: Rho termination factor N-terminal domain-containing protein, partial [Micromonosporaceae bacterium]|nr:Rho termination factor N-terminal domain-containing protein [Micromonosporaceae bacterium]